MDFQISKIMPKTCVKEHFSFLNSAIFYGLFKTMRHADHIILLRQLVNLNVDPRTLNYGKKYEATRQEEANCGLSILGR